MGLDLMAKITDPTDSTDIKVALNNAHIWIENQLKFNKELAEFMRRKVFLEHGCEQDFDKLYKSRIASMSKLVILEENKDFAEHWDALMKRRKDMHRQFANFLDAKGTLLDELNWKLEDMQSLCKELRSQSVKSLQSFEGKLKQMETAMIHLRKLQRKGTSSATNRRLLHEAETDCINKIAKYNGFVHAGAYEEEGTISRLIDTYRKLFKANSNMTNDLMTLCYELESTARNDCRSSMSGMEKLRGKWKAPEVNRILVESSQKALASLQPITFDQLYKRQIADTQRLTFPQPEDLPEKEFEDEGLDYGDDRDQEYPVLPLVNEDKSSQDNTFGHFSVRPTTP